MQLPEEHRQDDLYPGERDPRRPPGLFLVVIVLVGLCSLGYALYPGHPDNQPSPATSGDAPSAASNSPDAPAGK